MGTFGHPPDAARRRDVALVMVAAFGLAMSITFVWLGMRAVMSIGGACADGGPFVPVRPCPDGVPAAMVLGMLGLFGFGGLGMYAGSAIGGGWVALPLLGWPALFLSLGWNFLDFGFNPGPGFGWEWGWLIPGILFVLMGAVPLFVAWQGRSSATPIARRFGLPSSVEAVEPGPSPGWDPSQRSRTSSSQTPRPVTPAAVDALQSEESSDVVDRLERLAALRRRGDLTADEFERFKRALLRDAEDET